MKNFIYTAIILAIVLGLNGCAKRPASIAASHVSHERYSLNSCSQLNTKMSDARYKLTTASDRQNTKANGDAASVFLLGLPFSKLTGDFKGEVQAIETAQIRKGCR